MRSVKMSSSLVSIFIMERYLCRRECIQQNKMGNKMKWTAYSATIEPKKWPSTVVAFENDAHTWSWTVTKNAISLYTIGKRITTRERKERGKNTRSHERMKPNWCIIPTSLVRRWLAKPKLKPVTQKRRFNDNDSNNPNTLNGIESSMNKTKNVTDIPGHCARVCEWDWDRERYTCST